MSQKVNYSWKLNPTYRKLNTSEFCFFCLKTTKNKTETTDERDGCSNNNESKENSENPPISLLCLRRYLKINVNEIIGNSTCEPASFVNDEVEVNLCKVCKGIVCKFSVLFQQLEKIEMEMDYYLEEILSCIEKGIENPELVEAYSKGMTSKADTLSQLAWIDKLRKEIAKKCFKVRSAPRPIVEINKVAMEDNEIPSVVKEEVVSDIKEEGNKEELSPPASPSTSPSDSNPISNETENVTSAQSASMEFKVDKNTKKVHCSSCKQSFRTRRRVQIHFNVIHLKEKWKCELCSVEIRAWPDAVRNHKEKCQERLEKRSQEAKAREHFKFPCAICNKRFPNKTHLTQHKRLVHETSRPFPCTICGKGFTYACQLNTHKKSVHLGVRWKCKYCMKDFCQPGKRSMHEKRCLKKNDIKVETDVAAQLKFSRDLSTGRVPCLSCDKTFAETDQARRHYNNIHLKKKFKCDLCQATFIQSCIHRHRKSCADKLRRESHFLFSCPTCGKKIPTRKSLVQHQKRHLSKNQFPCDLCEKRYQSQQSLEYHKDSVHFNKTISCEYCKKEFKSRTIFEHIKRCKQRNLEVKFDSNDQKAEDRLNSTQPRMTTPAVGFNAWMP